MMESPTQSPVGLEPVTPRHPIGATTSRSKSGCIQCRTRKVKCDERPGGCATCQRLSFRCSFQPADAVSGRSPAGSHNSDDGYATAIARKRVRRACLQCRSQKLRCSGDSPKCERCMSKHLSCTYQSLPASRRNKGSTNRRYRFEGREQTRNSQPAEPANQNRTPMAMGSTSAISPMDTATTAPSLPQFVDTSKAVIQQHLDAFFQYVYPTATFNFIHRGSFLHSWHKDVLSRSLLRATVGVARRFMDLDREPAIRWLEESERDVVADLDLISIPKLQILLLLIFDRLASAKFSSTWYLMSLASRVAHGLKLGQPTSAVPFTNQECRRRLMWCVYSVERMGSTDGLCTTYPPLCPRPFMQVQLPCDERSFELEFECTTHYLDDLANNKYDNASKLGVSAYLIRVLDLREQIQTFCHRSDKPGQRSPWDGDSEFWRLEQELSDLSSSLPPEMQDSDRAVCIRSNTPESNVYIMVQTWLHTCWADLAGSFVYGRSVSEEDAAATTPSHNRTEFLESCRLILLEHAMALHRFWSRIQSTQPASRKLFTTDWNIAPCVYGNSRDILSTYASHPNLRVNSSQAIHAALRLNIDILSAQKSLTEYSARWYRKLIRLVAESAFAQVITPEEDQEQKCGEAGGDRPPRARDSFLSVEDELMARRRHEDARFPRSSGFRANYPQHHLTTRERAARPTTVLEEYSSRQHVGPGTDQQGSAFPGPAGFHQTQWSLVDEPLSEPCAQRLYETDGSTGFDFSLGAMDPLLGPNLLQDQIFDLSYAGPP